MRRKACYWNNHLTTIISAPGPCSKGGVRSSWFLGPLFKYDVRKSDFPRERKPSLLDIASQVARLRFVSRSTSRSLGRFRESPLPWQAVGSQQEHSRSSVNYSNIILSNVFFRRFELLLLVSSLGSSFFPVPGDIHPRSPNFVRWRFVFVIKLKLTIVTTKNAKLYTAHLAPSSQHTDTARQCERNSLILYTSSLVGPQQAR